MRVAGRVPSPTDVADRTDRLGSFFHDAGTPGVDDRTVGAGSLDRGDAEIELARFALELVRRGDDPERMASWIGGAAAALMARVSPECRALTAERLRQIASSLGGIELPAACTPDRPASPDAGGHDGCRPADARTGHRDARRG